MPGAEVVSFYRSLDDNCVWHLHHHDQVCSFSCSLIALVKYTVIDGIFRNKMRRAVIK